MELKRTSFLGEIVAEFLPPKHQTRDVVILCDGMPSGGSQRQSIEWFSKKGFWTFHLRYRGTWESSGRFLDHAPEQDVLDVIAALPNGFTDLWSHESFALQPAHVCVVGSSFGGTAALMASLHVVVQKVLAIAPVIDWTVQADEPLDWLEQVIRQGYGGAYRFSSDDWRRLSRGEFFQPQAVVNEFDPKKIFIAHAMDDVVVPIGPTQAFVSQVGCEAQFYQTGGHHLRKKMMRWPTTSQVLRFLRS